MTPRSPAARTAVLAAVLVAVLAAGCTPATAQPATAQPATAQPVSATTPASGDATRALTGLAVKGRAPMTGYIRAQFGQSWADVDHNGCDTRNDVLARDLTDLTIKPGTHGCVIDTGTLHDPYTSRVISYRRGPGSAAVQIDHVVALGDAWQTGAQQLDTHTRELLANDPLNLLAVDGPTNQAKGDADAASWLPPSRPYRCAYVARQVAVKVRYRLWVTPAEHDAITAVLSSCPGQALPAADSATTARLAWPVTPALPGTARSVALSARSQRRSRPDRPDVPHPANAADGRP